MTASDRAQRTLVELQPYIERARSFSGWSFGGLLRSRRLDPGEPWDYEAIARDYIDQLATRASSPNNDPSESAARAFSPRDDASASSAQAFSPSNDPSESVARAFSPRARPPRVLDLGTGGGEVLARIIAGRAGLRITATEEWHVNAPVAHRRLAPLGVDVAHASSLALPFADGAFDLVLDRHEELDPAGAARVLAPGGVIITQQCDSDNWREINRFFPRATGFEDHYRTYTDGFIAAGLEIVRRERCEFRTAFGSLGDITFLLITAPWTVPDFDPARDIEALLAMEDELGTPDAMVLTETRYLLIAEKPSRRGTPS